jgi:hypothetical protein
MDDTRGTERRSGAEAVLLQPGPEYWEITCRARYRAPDLLVALADILPSGLTLFIEGTSISPTVGAYFAKRPADNPLTIRRGVIWPRPKTYHMSMTPENVAGLVRLMEHLSSVEVGDHIHAYRGSTAYLIWNDAWFDSPLYLRKDVREEDVRRLCGRFGFEYASFKR